MRALRRLLLPLVALPAAGCFHQIVRTGLPAGTTVIDRPWVPTWVFGIVEAKPLDLRAECPSGAAVVETEQSFLNGLVGALTIGIYTPQHVRVTCASGSGFVPGADAPAVAVRVPAGATPEERAAAIQRAVRYSVEHGEPVLVRF